MLLQGRHQLGIDLTSYSHRIDTQGFAICIATDHPTGRSNHAYWLIQTLRKRVGEIRTAMQQNDLFKVLTIVSVVGIPPTLMAGIYGMNFKSMPELDWAWGYPYGLAIIALSALIPVIWFKWRGWF